MTALTCELNWLKGLMYSLEVSHPRAMNLHCDNQSAFYLAENLLFHERSKHIEVDCHFLRDVILDCTINSSYVPTTSQLAGIFKKVLGQKTV